MMNMAYWIKQSPKAKGAKSRWQARVHPEASDLHLIKRFQFIGLYNQGRLLTRQFCYNNYNHHHDYFTTTFVAAYYNYWNKTSFVSVIIIIIVVSK